MLRIGAVFAVAASIFCSAPSRLRAGGSGAACGVAANANPINIVGLRDSMRSDSGKQVPPSDYPADAEATWYFVEGLKRSYIDGDTALAAYYFRQALAADSLHAAAAFELAALLQYTSADAAEPFAERAVELDSTNSWYVMQLGRIKVMREEYDSALVIYRHLVNSHSEYPENYRILAALYEQREQPFSAIAILDSAERRFGVGEPISSYKRQLLISTGQYDEALKQSTALIEANPYSVRNYLLAAELYIYLKQDSLAKKCYDKAFEIDSTDTDLLMALSDYYNSHGDISNYMRTMEGLFAGDGLPLDRKMSICRRMMSDRSFYGKNYWGVNGLIARLLTRYPESYDVMELYADHLLAGGEVDQALVLYKAHVYDSVPRINTFNVILDLESYQGRADSVEKYTALAMKLFPDNAELYLRRGTYYFMQKDYASARKALKQAVRKIRGDSLLSVTYSLLGDSYMQEEEYKPAVRYYEEAIEADPDNHMALNNFAYSMCELGQQLERALAMSRRANELNRNEASYLDTEAWILYKLHCYEEARTIMRQAIMYDRSGDSVLLLHYGDILYALGEEFMAKVYWEKAADAGFDRQAIEARLNKLKDR